MNAPEAPHTSPRRRRRWPWVLAFLLSPVVLLAVMAVSFLTLSREAAVLRDGAMAASDHAWNTKVQVSVGRLALGCLRFGLRLVPEEKLGEARAALEAVKSVSVGVYQPVAAGTQGSRETLFNQTDREMAARGWMRLAGVAEPRENVLVYVPTEGDDLRAVCVAVLTRRELVVVAAQLDAAAVVEFVARHAGRRLPAGLLPFRKS